MWHSMTINHKNLWQNSSRLLLFRDLIHHPLVQYFRRDVRLCFSHSPVTWCYYLVAQLSKYHNSTVISSLFTLAIKCPAFPWPQVKCPDFPLAFPIPLLSMTFPKFPGQWEPWQFKLMIWFLTIFLRIYYYYYYYYYWVSRHQKGKPLWILLYVWWGGSGISWTICKSFAPCSRQITMLVLHHSVFYRPDALPAAQPTVSKHWRK